MGHPILGWNEQKTSFVEDLGEGIGFPLMNQSAIHEWGTKLLFLGGYLFVLTPLDFGVERTRLHKLQTRPKP